MFGIYLKQAGQLGQVKVEGHRNINIATRFSTVGAKYWCNHFETGKQAKKMINFFIFTYY